MSSDPGDVICDAIVEYVNSSERDYSHEFTADAPDDPAERLAQSDEGEAHRTTEVFFAPVSEVRERLDDAGVNVRHTINGFVTRYLIDGVTRKSMQALTREIVTSLDFQGMDDYCWEEAEIITKYDAEKLASQNRFLSVFALTYYGIE